MLRLLETEVNAFLDEMKGDERRSFGTIATGLLAERAAWNIWKR